MMSYTAFLYYTIQSNIVIIIISIIFLYLHYLEFKSNKTYTSNSLLVLKFSLTVAITVTFLVFFILLAPTLSTSYLLFFDNFSVHLIVPLLAIIDFFIFDYKIDLSKARPLVGLIMPGYYLIFALVLLIFGVEFHGEIVPYFFMNYEILGWTFEKGQMGVIF